MLKTTVFIGVLLAIMVALQPSFFAGLVGIKLANNSPATNPEASPNAQTLQEATQGKNSEPNGVQKKLVSADMQDLSPAQGQTQYAQGYSKDNFGKAYDAPEDMFPDAPKDKTQLEGIWRTLMEATYNIKYDERLDDMVFIPVFTKDIKALENKEIELKGYILPHDITKMDKSGNKGNMFMFSAFPAQSCFFCGAAGPESIVEVNPKKPIPYSKSAVKIKGKLKLNTTDFLRMFYILEDAKLSE